MRLLFALMAWVIWVVVAGVLGLAEIHTLTLVLGMLAVAALPAALVAGLGGSAAAQFLTFAGASVLALGVVRPIARLRIEVAQIHPSTALVGREAIVLERIANREAVGCVEIDGELWTARAFDEERVIERGTRVEVVEMKGATALVTE